MKYIEAQCGLCVFPRGPYFLRSEAPNPEMSQNDTNHNNEITKEEQQKLI